MANGVPDFTKIPACKLNLAGCHNGGLDQAAFAPIAGPSLAVGWVYDTQAGCYFCPNCRPWSSQANAAAPTPAQLQASYAAIAAKAAATAAAAPAPAPIPVVVGP